MQCLCLFVLSFAVIYFTLSFFTPSVWRRKVVNKSQPPYSAIHYQAAGVKVAKAFKTTSKLYIPLSFLHHPLASYCALSWMLIYSFARDRKYTYYLIKAVNEQLPINYSILVFNN